MLDDDTTTPSNDVAPATPPRRRRAASRPAGPPAPVTEAPQAPSADTPSPVSDAPVAQPVVADAAPTPTDAVTVPEAVTTPESEPVREAAPRSRTRSRRKAPTPDEAAAPVDAAQEAEPQEVPAEPAQPTLVAPVEAETAAGQEAPAVRPSRARRSRAAQADAPADDVAASLAELSQRSGRRRQVKAETFGLPGATSPEDILNQLAAAIGAGTPASVPTPDAEDDEALVPDELAEDAERADAEQEDADLELDEDEEIADSEDDDAQLADDVPGEPRRRRRRRGGRRRRRSSGNGDAAADLEGEPESEGAEAEEAEEADGSEASLEPAAEGGSRRRRRRRRRGEDTGEADDDPSIEVVARVREPRRSRSVSDEVTGIEGSTRMEAKKQRRREGRAAGRRRAAILSEAEFLARRESVDRKMLIRQAEDYAQIAVLEDGILVEHYVDRASAMSMIGNIYLGRVQNVLPSMEAAFVDIGRGRNAVLYAGEVDWAAYGVTGQDKKVEKVFKSGQTVLVQVTKDPVGAKGARLTSHISIPGRYIVYSPGGQLSGISRKLPENERKRLKGILDELIGPDASVIIRTAAEGASEEELVRDVNRLKAQWEVIEKKVASGQAPSLLYGEPDLTVRIVRDLFTEDFGALIVDGDDTWDTVQAYVTHVAPHLADRLQRWDRGQDGDVFDAHRVHEQVAKALERKVFLPSGGSLIIDRTEAMTVIDVNTGRFTGTSGNLEATVTSNNLEAAEEIVRQLRLRDIGGIIVIDFIDMVLPSNRELLLRRLVECLGRDRTRHQVAEVTSLGLVQMTRKKIGTGLAEAFTVPCETCKGRGYHTHDVPVASQAPADGGDRESKRGGRGGSQQPAKQRAPRVRKPAPELAAVVAATLAHPVSPELAHVDHHADGEPHDEVEQHDADGHEGFPQQEEAARQAQPEVTSPGDESPEVVAEPTPVAASPDEPVLVPEATVVEASVSPEPAED